MKRSNTYTAILLAVTSTSAYSQFCEIPHNVNFDDIPDTSIAFSAAIPEQKLIIDQFPFEEMMTQISGTSNSSNHEKLVLDMLHGVRPHPRFPVTQTHIERVANNIDWFEPIGIFNRIDLRKDSQSCGEFRIAYSLNTTLGHFRVTNPERPEHSLGDSDIGHFFNIEAEYPLIEGGCEPIAEYWLNIGESSPDDTAQMLRDFFYNGFSVNGERFEPAFTLNNFTAGKGQIRTNSFLNMVDSGWEFKEFNLSSNNGQITVIDSTVASTLSHGAVRGTSMNSPNRNTIASYVQTLLTPERDEINNTDFDRLTILNPVELDSNSLHNAQRSNMVLVQNDPTIVTDDRFTTNDLSDDFRDEISLQLSQLRSQNPGSTHIENLTLNTIVGRLNKQTCGGCHTKAEDNTSLSSMRFFHVNHLGEFSTVLTDDFIPFRKRELKQLLCSDTNHSDPTLPPTPPTIETPVATPTPSTIEPPIVVPNPPIIETSLTTPTASTKNNGGTFSISWPLHSSYPFIGLEVSFNGGEWVSIQDPYPAFFQDNPYNFTDLAPGIYDYKIVSPDCLFECFTGNISSNSVRVIVN